MRRYLLTCSLALTCATAAVAQTPALGVSHPTPAPGAIVRVFINGAPGQNYALLASSVGAGMSFGGVNLAVGTDFTIVAVGVLDGTGHAEVPFTPPFVGTTLDRYYLQAATSPSPAFAPLAVSNSFVLRNADVVLLPTVAIVNPNGTVQFASEGVTVTRTGLGLYHVTYASDILPVPTVATASVIGPQHVTGITRGLGFTDVRFDGDATFVLFITPARR